MADNEQQQAAGSPRDDDPAQAQSAEEVKEEQTEQPDAAAEQPDQEPVAEQKADAGQEEEEAQNEENADGQAADNTGEQTETNAEMTEQTAGDGQQVEEPAAEQAGEQPTEQTGEQNTEQTGEQTSEQTGEQNTEQAGEETNEQADEQATEQTGEQTTEEAGEQKNEQADEQTGEQTNDQAAEQTDEQAGKQTPEQANEPTNVQGDEEAGEQLAQEEEGAGAQEEASAQGTRPESAQAAEQQGEQSAQNEEVTQDEDVTEEQQQQQQDAEQGESEAQVPSAETEEGGAEPEQEQAAAKAASPPLPEQQVMEETADTAAPPQTAASQGSVQEQEAAEEADDKVTYPSPTMQAAQAMDVVPQPPPPPPMTDGMSETQSTFEDRPPPNALNLSWSFGMNRNVPVINMTDESRQQIMYCCAHTGILYDFKQNKQTLLQGHSNAITCTCVSGDKRWLATADKGDDSMVIIWDSYSGIPVRTIFDPHPDGGVAAMAMTPDAKYLATISAAETQTLAIWDWTVEGEVPICTAELSPSYGQQTYIYFNPEDITQMVTNSDSQVIFYSWKTGNIEYFAPPLTDDDFNKPVGKFSQSIFLSHSTRALTATSIGNLVVWDTNKPLTKVVSNETTPDKKALKLVKLQDRGINVLTTTEKHIVSGDVLGHVKFFDQKLKLLCWYQDFHLGPINSISFAHEPMFVYERAQTGKFPSDATIAARPFGLRDFILGTTNAIFAHVNTDGTDVTVIHKDHDAAVFGLASHPSQPWIAVGSYSGCLKIWDYEKKETITARVFDKGLMIRCCNFDPNGKYIAVGFLNGSVRVLDVPSLNDALREPFRYARDAITHVAFSHNCQFLAVADAEYTVSLFKKEPGKLFGYMGRYRAHYKLIVDIQFGVQLDSDLPRLMSLGEDRVLVEYDLEKSTTDNIVILSSDRIEQSAIPLCMEWYPTVTKESFILTANDQFKFKLYNSTTKMCRKTLLGPTFGTPLQKVVVVPTADPVKDKRYMGYITADKIGLHILPLDGNPHNSMALIAHPQGVVNLVSSHDGKYLFTAGGMDATVHMWDINTSVLEAQSKLGGADLVPFYGLLDGGREGELFKELEDLFYYAQIRSQGVNTTEAREVCTTIPVSEIPFVMRALGFYPSEQEIEDMLNEVKYSNYVETGQYTTAIDLGDFIKLYTNHRPAFGLQPEKLQWAFEVLGYQYGGGTASLERGELLDVLQNRGEHITEYELAEYLTTLLGYNEEGGSSEQQQFDPTTAGDIIDDNLPHEINAEMFSNDLLGFGMYSDVLAVDQGEGSQMGERQAQATV